MFPVLCPHRRPLSEDGRPFSLICPNCICQNLVMLESDWVETVTTPAIVAPNKVYNVPDLCSFTISRTPIDIFISPPSPVYLHPRDSRVPNEMIFKSGTYITLTAVPTFLYGAAQQEGRSLDSIRRELGYFHPNSSENQWIGGTKLETLQLKPDEGPPHATQAKGVITIGATRWVDNYNIPVFTNDISIVRKIAKRVSGRGGGLPSVQSMALTHGGGTIEVACNLLEPTRIGGNQVQLEVERLAMEEGISVGKGYYTDLSEENIIESYLKLVQHSD